MGNDANITNLKIQLDSSESESEQIIRDTIYAESSINPILKESFAKKVISIWNGTAGKLNENSNRKPEMQTGNVELLGTGLDAINIIVDLLNPAKEPIIFNTNFGELELKSGTIIGETLIVLPEYTFIVYAKNDKVFNAPRNLFIQNFYLDAMSHGANKASLVMHLAQLEIIFLQAIFLPWYIIFSISAVKLIFIYRKHKKIINEGFILSKVLVPKLISFNKKYPKVAKSLGKSFLLYTILYGYKGITDKEIAFYIGKILNGLRSAPELTIGTVIKVFTKTTIIVSITKLPIASLKSVRTISKEKIQEIKNIYKALGIELTEDEIYEMFFEIKSNDNFLTDVEDLVNTLNSLKPVLEKLNTILYE